MADFDYLSRFSGEEVDQRLAAVATIQAALESLIIAVAAKYSKPAGGIPETDLDADVRAALALARSAVQSLSGYYTSAQVDGIVQALELAIAAKYSKPSGGIPASDLASAVQASLGKADSAYQKPATGIPSSDMANGVQASLGKADTAYQKPASGIPASDLAAGVIPDVSGFVTKSVNDLVNYYLKSETYTKAEVQQLIAAIQGLSVEVVASLPTASADTMRKIYLVPSADPQTQNVKDEYITIDNGAGANPRYTWEQIGSTAIDLSGYVTTTQLNTALAAYTTTANLTTLLAAKQDTISDLSTIRSGAAAGATAYQKPQTGIPSSDLAPGVIPTVPTDIVKFSPQTLTDAQKEQARTNIGAAAASALTALETAIAAKYTKPQGGIPETDLDASVQAALALARTAVQSLSDYYTKAQVDDITAAIAASVDSTSGVVVTTLPSAGAGTLGKIYYVGPDADGFYDRYVTSYDGSTYSWLALGNTEVDMTQYATVEQLNQLDQKVDDLSTGKYYGYFATSADLPDDATVDGFAYVGEGPTYTIYNCVGGVWTSSGVTVNQSPIGNGEDIDQDAEGKLQFAPRVYNSSQPDGMGYKILRKGATFASQVTDTNTIYEIRYDFDLGGNTLNIPANCVLHFNGGCLHNGILNGNNTSINEDVTYKIFDNITPKNFEFACFDIRWIGAIPGDTELDSAPYFQKAMDLCEFYQSLPIRVIGKYKIATTVVCRNHFQLFGCNFTTRAFGAVLPEYNNSVIYVPANVTAFHVSGIQLTTLSYCSFNVHNLRFEGGDRNTSVLFKVTTSGAPSRPCVFAQCESYGFNKVFHIAHDENIAGTMVSQWVIRENNIAGNTSFISTDQTEKLTLMNLDIIDNVLEQNFGKAIVIYNPAGYINFENNMIESNADFTISIPQTSKQCHLNVCGNYLEGAKPFLSIMADSIVQASGAVTLKCHDNYFYQGVSVNKYQIVLQNVIVDDIDSGRYISDDSSFVGCYFSKSANIAELSISCLGEFNGFEELPEFDCGEFVTTPFRNTGLTIHNVVNGRIVNRKDIFGTSQLSTYGFAPATGTAEGDIAIAMLYCGLSGDMSLDFAYGISNNKHYLFPRPGFALVKRAYPASGNNNISVTPYISTTDQYAYYSCCVTILQLKSHPEVKKVGDLSVGKNMLVNSSVPLPSSENAGLVATIALTKKVMWMGNAWKNLDGTALA